MICFFSSLSRAIKHLKYCVLLACALVLALVQPASAKTFKFAVVVPQTSSKAQFIYDNIVRGMSRVADVELEIYPIRSVDKRVESALHKKLADSNADAIISIGKSAHTLVKDFPTKIPLIAGGVSISPSSASGVSLTGDPEEFFANLRRIAPQVDRVFIIYNREINGWWVDIAVAQAKLYDIELKALVADDVKSGARLYQRTLERARFGKDAIWIPLVSIVPAKTVMPMVLKTAWDKNLVVFSNSAAHTRQGALFSLYPNNFELGKQLVELAIELATANSATVKVVPVKKLRTAFNASMAQHLGLKNASGQDGDFDKVYRTGL